MIAFFALASITTRSSWYQHHPPSSLNWTMSFEAMAAVGKAGQATCPPPPASEMGPVPAVAGAPAALVPPLPAPAALVPALPVVPAAPVPAAAPAPAAALVPATLVAPAVLVAPLVPVVPPAPGVPPLPPGAPPVPPLPPDEQAEEASNITRSGKRGPARFMTTRILSTFIPFHWISQQGTSQLIVTAFV